VLLSAQHCVFFTSPPPPLLLPLALRLDTVGASVQFNSKMLSLFSSLNCSGCRSDVFILKHRITAFPRSEKCQQFFSCQLAKHVREMRGIASETHKPGFKNKNKTPKTQSNCETTYNPGHDYCPFTMLHRLRQRFLLHSLTFWISDFRNFQKNFITVPMRKAEQAQPASAGEPG